MAFRRILSPPERVTYIVWVRSLTPFVIPGAHSERQSVARRGGLAGRGRGLGLFHARRHRHHDTDGAQRQAAQDRRKSRHHLCDVMGLRLSFVFLVATFFVFELLLFCEDIVVYEAMKRVVIRPIIELF